MLKPSTRQLIHCFARYRLLVSRNQSDYRKQFAKELKDYRNWYGEQSAMEMVLRMDSVIVGSKEYAKAIH